MHTHNLHTRNLLTHTTYSHTTCTHTLCGKSGTLWHPPSLCVAGVATLWHRPSLRRGCLRGRRGTSWHGLLLCVAGMALDDIHLRFTWQAWNLDTQLVNSFITQLVLGDMDRHFAWQAWHAWHWAGSGGALGSHMSPWTPRLFAWQAWHLATCSCTLRGRLGTLRHPPSLCLAGVALRDMDCYFAWQAWHFETSTFVHLRFTWQAWHVWHWAGSGGALGSHMSPWTPRLFAWQAWHLATCSCTLRGRLGTLRHPPSLCVAGVALRDMDCYFAWQAWHFETSTFVHLRFTWQAWHVWHWAGSGGALGSHMSPWTPRLFAWQAWHLATCSCTLRGRRGTLRHPPSLCLAGVALRDMDCYFAWQAWHFETSTFVHLRFTWQAWHVWHWAGSGGALGSHMSPWTPRFFAWQAWHLATCSCTLRGRRGTLRHPPSSSFVSRGRRGTYGTGLAPMARLVPGCGSGMAPRLLAWQAWHFETSTFTFTWQACHRTTCPHTTCHPHNLSWQTWHFLTHNLSSHILSSHNLLTHTLFTSQLASHTTSSSHICVAGVARMALGWLWWRARFPHVAVEWHCGFLRGRRGTWRHVAALSRGRRGTLRHPPSSTFVSRGRRGTYGTGLALVARSVPTCRRGMAPRLFAWQTWHFETSTFVSRGRRGTLVTSTFTLCGRRGTYGIELAPVAHLGRSGRDGAAAVGVAGVALWDIHLRFTWQVWHLATWMVTLRGRRGTYGIGLAPVAHLGRSGRDGASAVGVAGVALWDIHLRFTWQAWYLVTSTFTLCGRRGTYGIGLAPVARLGRSGREWRCGCWRGTLRHPPLFHVAGVVLGDIPTDEYITFPKQLFLLLDPSHHLLCFSFLPRHNFCTHTHTHTHTHTSHTTHHHTTYPHLLFHTQLTPPQSFTISFLFPTFPMPSLPFFYCLLEEVDMWGYPVL